LAAAGADRLFALRWRDLDEERQCLIVREAVYDGRFGTPKTVAGVRQIPLSEAAMKLIVTSATVEPARFDIARWASGGIILSSVATRYQLGFVLHAGSVTRR
jgi:hypothetical protein